MRLSIVQQLALYNTFHRERRNRLIHAVFVPVVMLTGLVVASAIAVPGVCAVNLGTALAVSFSLALAPVDRFGAIVLGAWLSLGAMVGGQAIAAAPWAIVPAILGHLLAWYMLVRVGHGRCEGNLDVAGKSTDSNLYFREGWFVLRGLRMDWLSVVVQLGIAPLAASYDVLFTLGFRADLERDVDGERAGILERLAQGEAPLPALSPFASGPPLR